MPEMTKNERSLLVYLEARAVDHGGLVDTIYMNTTDMEIAEQWNESGFVRFGRLAFESIEALTNSKATHWCRLSDKAWLAAHAERRARSARMLERRTWITTEEKREGDDA